MATKAQRERAQELAKQGLEEAEAGAEKLEEAFELMGRPPFQNTHLFGASGELHDFRAFYSKVANFARGDIYHD